MEHACEVVQGMLVTRDQPTKIQEPRKQPLDLPAATTPSQASPILRQLRAGCCDAARSFLRWSSQFTI
jgi:hypothetical protein